MPGCCRPPRPLLGTDELGRDILSRTLYGARISLIVAVCVVALSFGIGLIAGALAGFYGGWLDAIINIYVMNAFLALPGILLAIAFVAFLGPGCGTLSSRSLSRLGGLCAAGARAGDGGEGTRICGSSAGAGRRRYAHPAAAYPANIMQPLIVQAAIGMAGAVLAEATLSFLGLGIPPPAASWGSMMNDARSHLFESPYMVAFPAIAVMLCVLSFNFIGDALRDRMDPRTRLSTGI